MSLYFRKNNTVFASQWVDAISVFLVIWWKITVCSAYVHKWILNVSIFYMNGFSAVFFSCCMSMSVCVIACKQWFFCHRQAKSSDKFVFNEYVACYKHIDTPFHSTFLYCICIILWLLHYFTFIFSYIYISIQNYPYQFGSTYNNQFINE